MGLITSISKETLLVVIVALVIVATLIMIMIIHYKKKLEEQSLQIDRYKVDSVRNLELRQSLETTQRQLNSLSKQYDKIDLKNKEVEAKNIALLAQATQSNTGMGKGLSHQQQMALQLENTRLKEDLSLLAFSGKETSQDAEIKELREIVDQLEQNNLELTLQITQRDNQIDQLKVEQQAPENQERVLLEKLTKSEANNQKMKEIVMQQATRLMQLKKEAAQVPLNDSDEFTELLQKNKELEMLIAKNQLEYQEKITVLAKKLIEAESQYSECDESALKNQIEQLQAELNQQKVFTEDQRQALDATIVTLQKELELQLTKQSEYLAEKECILAELKQQEGIPDTTKVVEALETEIERLNSMLEQKNLELSEQQHEMSETLQASTTANETLHRLETEVNGLNSIILTMEKNQSNILVEKEKLGKEIDILNQQINNLKSSAEHTNHAIIQENKKLKDKLIQLKSVIGNAFDS